MDAHSEEVANSLDPNISSILTLDEEILWSGTPSVSSLICKMALFDLLIVFTVSVVYYMGLIRSFLFPLFIVLAIAIFIEFLIVLVQSYVEYVITNKRMIIKKGFWSSTTMFLDFEKIADIEICEGLISSSLFGLGSIYVNINTSIKKIKKRDGNQMIVDEIHKEETRYNGLIDYIVRSTPLFIELENLSDYANVYQILERAKQGKIKNA